MRIRWTVAAVAAAAFALAGCAGTPPAGAARAAVVKPLPDDAVVTWTDDALAAFQAEVPKAVQKIAKKQAEKDAREAGLSVIDLAFYEGLKKKQGY